MGGSDHTIKTIAKGAIIFFIGTVLAKILTYAFRIIVARTGVEDYGLLSLGLAVFGAISVFCMFGMDTGLYGYLSSAIGKKKKEDLQKTIKSATKFSATLGILCGFLLFILADFLANNIFHNDKLTLVLQTFAIMLPIGLLRTIFQTSLRSFQKIKEDTISRVAENVVKLIALIILLYLGYGLFGVILAYALSALASFLIALALFEKKIFPVLTCKVNAKLIDTDLLLFSWPLLLNSILMMALTWTDTMMIGYFQDAVQVGLYNVAVPTANLISMLTKSVMAIFLPVTAALYLENKGKELSTTYKTITRWVFLLNSFPLLVLLMFHSQVLTIFFGNAYYEAYVALIILSCFFFISSLADIPRDILLMLKRTKTIFHITLTGVFTNILLNLALIPLYGFIGAAVATGFSFFVTTSLFFTMAYKKMKIPFFNFTQVKILIALGITLLIGTIAKGYINLENLTTLLIFGTGTVLIYLFLLILFRCVKKEEIMVLRAIVHKAKNLRKS